ncbi:cysteine hydrolase family protein [uncultured Clostridium sp.]|uniref:cysteine hydrolase family protein n=1 Tax=uncultured Clostridium sp. TaxID=59620 RepID=UPI0026100A69|nr:cysteine hydrolase family protein [uncultured Clostridium sp.]
MKKALLIIDLQNDYFEGGKFPLWNTEKTLENIEEAIDLAHKNDVTIVHIQHVADPSLGLSPFFNEGTEGVKIHQRILEKASEGKVVVKTFADGFFKTDLEKVLSEIGAEEILVCGMMTQNCVTHTAISKAAEKYKVSILADCCTSVSEPIHLIGLAAVMTRDIGIVSYKEIL